MITDRGMEQTLKKLRRLTGTLKNRLFTPVGYVETTLYETTQTLHQIPDDGLFAVPSKEKWGGEGVYGWFRGSYTVPEAL